MIALKASGENTELWEETVAGDFDGGDTVQIQTSIRATAAELAFVKVDVYPATKIGTPEIVPTVGLTNGLIRVALQNQAPPGNQCTYEVEIRRDHSQVR